jgi:hypothetical protein
MPEALLDGQKVNYNPETKIAVTSIKSPFMGAGYKLGWKWRPQGIGLNLKVVQFLLQTKFTLVLNVEKFHHTYYLTHSQLFEYLRDNECDWKVKTVIVKVIPLELFTSYKVHSA